LVQKLLKDSGQISTFKDIEFSETEKELQAKFPFIKLAYELSVELSRGLAEAATGTQQLVVLETVLEKCQNAWGFRPAIIAAQIDCASQRRVKPSTAPFDFFASAATTAQRLRAAKARGINGAWWLNALEQSKAVSRPSRLLLIEALCILCPMGTIAHCEALLAEMLDAMPDEEWGTLVRTCSYLRNAARRTPNKDEATKQPAFRLESMRFSYLMTIRDADRLDSSVFLKFFRNYTGSELPYQEFTQAQAINCAIKNLLSWDEALQIVREGYARGVCASELDYRLRNGPAAMLAEVYSEVLSNSESYPVAVCDAAEAAATRAARRAVKPVSTVAKNERWFAFDS